MWIFPLCYCLGVPEKLIPSFWSVRSTMYRLKPNRTEDDIILNNNSSSSTMEFRSSIQQQSALKCNITQPNQILIQMILVFFFHITL